MMTLLIAAISFALLISIGLPIAAGTWLNRKYRLAWRVVLYGALGYLIVQAVLVFVFNGFATLVENGSLFLSEEGVLIVQIFLSVFLGALLGVLIRWLGMKFLNEKLDTLEAAVGIGIGYGGVESVLMVGLPLLSTFVTMLSNMNIDQATSTLDTSIIIQIEELWQVSALVPLAGSIERITALVLHLTVTILILQSFARKRFIWVVSAIGLELFVNGIIIGLAEIGLQQGWLVLVSGIFMLVNLFLLYRLGVQKIFQRYHDESDELNLEEMRDG